ncbi:MAG: hypothetical protein H7Z72_09120 [Bacteroidetes bacterium]|nr:hypothetical protein [Fibrella sp.]
MSLKNFYQAFYQTEQLFRLDDDPFAALMAPPTTVAETLLIDIEPTEPDALPVTTLPPDTPPFGLVSADDAPDDIPEPVIEPFVEPEPLPEQPVMLDPAPVRTMPSTHRPGVERPDAPVRPLLNHKVLILVDEELLPSDVLFLEKILNAINLNVNGVDLLNVHGLDGVDFAPILADKVIHHFLTFGVPFQRLNLDILMDRYQPVRFHGITFMMADPLAAIEGDKILKKRLWEALKRIFLMG